MPNSKTNFISHNYKHVRIHWITRYIIIMQTYEYHSTIINFSFVNHPKNVKIT